MALIERIQTLKAEHPYWGYRRIWAYFKYHEKIPVNQKRLHRLMRLNNLLVPKNLKLKAPRKAVTHKPRTVEPNRYWGIDMTKVMISAFGWVYLHVVIDWGTKKLLSTHMSLTSKSADWIEALNEAVNLQFPEASRTRPLFRSWSAIIAVNRLQRPSSRPVPGWASARYSPVTAIPKATPTRNG